MAEKNFTWSGDKISKKFARASEKAVNEVMEAAVKTAKFNHPGWKNITTLAEGSVQIIKFAKFSNGVVVGLWGSKNVNYVIWLELNHGSFLRRSADVEYPKLGRLLKAAFRGPIT
jgi:hypothetical protein